jgi:hypothetical protein
MYHPLPVPESGEYRFRTQVKDERKDVWKDVADVPLDITVEAIQAT